MAAPTALAPALHAMLRTKPLARGRVAAPGLWTMPRALHTSHMASATPRASSKPAPGKLRTARPAWMEQQMAEEARRAKEAVAKKTLWQSWLSLTPRVRMTVGTAFAVFAVFGLFLSDRLEQWFPAEQPDDSRQPKLFSVSVVPSKE